MFKLHVFSLRSAELRLKGLFLFICGFTSHSRIFHSFGDFTAADFDLCSALMAIEQRGFFSVPHPLWYMISVIIVISKDSWHLHLLPSVWQWNCHPCFNDLCQSRPKIEFQSPACKQIWVPFSRVYSLPNTRLFASWDDRTENDDIFDDSKSLFIRYNF